MLTIHNEEIRYPEKGDRLFISKGDHESLAWLKKAFSGFGSYADSYQLGALTLLNSTLEEPRFRDYQVYPIIFLIRHYAELRLKELIQGLNYCLSQSGDFPNGHRLPPLWDDFKRLYSKIGEDANDSRFQTIDELLKEISMSDPESMSFRYPVNKKGEPLQTLEYVNLVNLKEIFVRVSFVFDAVAMQIATYVEYTDDMRDAMYSYYEGDVYE